MGTAGKREDRPPKSGYWPRSKVDPRSLVDRPCRFNPEMFTSTNWADRANAKASCNGCPQRTSCLEHGLELDDAVDYSVGHHTADGEPKHLVGIEGVYGGLTRTERVKLRLSNRVPSH